MDELDKVRELFLTDVDEDTLAENRARIQEWERDLVRHKAYEQWKGSDITREINQMVRAAYKEHSIALATNRNLTDKDRMALWAKQDACVFLLNLTDQDAKAALESILRDIRHALS